MASPYLLQILINLIAAPVFVGLAGLIPMPWRHRAMAALMLVAAVVYLDGGLGLWEFGFAAVLFGCALAGFRDVRAVGVGWLVHTVSDAIHHANGLPMVTSMPLSSFGCAVFDPLIAIWFFAGAPSTRQLIEVFRGQRRVA
jgi:hypothetical protein